MGRLSQRSPKVHAGGGGRYWLVMVASLLRQRGGLRQAIRWLLMYATARVLVVRRAARRVANQPSTTSIEGAQSVDESNVSKTVESLRVDGFDSRLRLPSAICRELVALGEEVTTTAPHSEAAGDSPQAVDRAAASPLIREIAASYLGGTPFYQGSRIWWTRPGAPDDPLQTGARFHYDLYDYRALVFLIYLTDVDRDSAPHICVRGSHKSRGWRNQLHWRRHRSDEEIVRLYGSDRIVTICGETGTVIAEDPFCFHKVKLPATRDRLALQLLFTCNDFPAPPFRRP